MYGGGRARRKVKAAGGLRQTLRRRRVDLLLAVAALVVVAGVFHVIEIGPRQRDKSGWNFRVDTSATSPEPRESSGIYAYAYEGTVHAYGWDCYVVTLRHESSPDAVYEKGYFVPENGWYREVAHVTADGKSTYEEVWGAPRLRFTWPVRRPKSAPPLIVGDVFTDNAVYKSGPAPGFENATVAVRAEVVGEERINVAAGGFDCYRIDFEENVESDAISLTYSGTAWYWPQGHLAVKTQYTVTGAVGTYIILYVEGQQTYELVSEGPAL